jgi:type IV pilus assembly protein PilV
MRMSRGPVGRRHQAGVSLIEVLIAVLILAFGMLGFALMQTMGVRFAESSNYRTQATNLAYDMLDMMRSNRLLAAQYDAADFSGGVVPTRCDRTAGAASIQQNITTWQCRVRTTLGENANATVTYTAGVATVVIGWNDQRWEADATRKAGAYESGRVRLETRL